MPIAGRMTTPTTLDPLAMPCTACTNSTGADMQAAYAYWVSRVAPVDVPGGINALPFPFNISASMIGGNRGAGLVKGAAHCATCHTARSILIRAMGGPQVGVWYAPNIPSAPEAGIGSGSREEIVADPATGRTEGKARGSMAEAVEHSFSRMTQDIRRWRPIRMSSCRLSALR
jgi:fructose 5-dehydrogenase cytochrome subunit